MNRHDVVHDNWVERYLLGQLSDDEQSEFEQFFFTCAETQEDIETTQKLIDGFGGNAIAALAKKHKVEVDTGPNTTAASVQRWNLPALAASVVAAVSLSVAFIGWQSKGPSTPTQVASINVPIVSLGITRSVAAAQLVELPATPVQMVFSLDLGGELNEHFALQLKNSDGDIVWQATPLIADQYGSVTFSLPPGLLAVGNFEFVAEPVNSSGRLRIPVLIASSDG
ncbi:MAG: hypothetical protein AAGC71_01295 [Pseudomonadota bacterium]